jgi:transposase
MEEQSIRAEATLAEAPGATPKRGETPRQQIRKAKANSRRQFSAEEKIRIVMEGIRGDEPVSAICRREGVHTTVYYKWLKDFMEAGKRRLRGDMQREAGRQEVAGLREENARLKQLVAEYALDLMALKKSLLAES